MESAKFTVDAALLRELGEHLISRDYIALAELVKNSYDADATSCRIQFSAEEIVVADNGHGMSAEEFHNYWMRIGTTHKTDKQTSRRLGRPMTGSKGLGRLSVQFLATKMTLESWSVDDPSCYLYAFVDWTGIRRGSDHDTVDVQWEMRSSAPGNPGRGTRVVLMGLRSTWDAKKVGELGQQVWMLQPPYRQSGRQSDNNPDDFYVEIDAPDIDNAREAFEQFNEALLRNWKARIRGTLVDGRSRDLKTRTATVSVEFKEGYPKDVKSSNSFAEDVALPINPSRSKEPAVDRAEFEILIFKPDGRQPGGMPVRDMRAYLHNFGNVSVYDGGFRLPYYGASQDWLEIAVDQGRRRAASTLLPSNLHIRERYLEDLPAPGRIFGSVEIDTNHERSVADGLSAGPGSCLRISAGRDRLADNSAFDELRDLVRFSLDFYANRYRLLKVRVRDQAHTRGGPPSTIYGEALKTLDSHRDELSVSAYRQIREALEAAKNTATLREEVLDSRAEMLAPLATAGMTALALNHELTREIALLERTRDRLRAAATVPDSSTLAPIAADLDGAIGRMGALQQLFDPLLSAADREATDRLRVRSVVHQVVHAFQPLLPGVSIETSEIPEWLRFPVGAFAEWNAILQNLLTNAWNAMLDSDQALVSFDGGRGPRAQEWLRVSDTGVGLDVPLDESEILFEPFERRLKVSAENKSIAIAGQGLGLSIVRMIARRRKAQVVFAQPKSRFATSLEISWKGAPE
ncbi:MAG: hypothetical protein F4Y71_07010 [Acidobacteria bacterium]|nr:hypothetical protein [Acidobacteriota bacterium]MYG74199.1 hypothetical protein [Acidobacteriota bacterium]